jgi:hypothetical protein
VTSRQWITQTNIAHDVTIGFKFGVGLALFATVARLLGTTPVEGYTLSLVAVWGICLTGGAVGGAIFAIGKPLRRSWYGTAFLGFLVALTPAALVRLSFREDIPFWWIIPLAAVVGPINFLVFFWRDWEPKKK